MRDHEQKPTLRNLFHQISRSDECKSTASEDLHESFIGMATEQIGMPNLTGSVQEYKV
jgi:hypothetical protein